ncbi:Integrator complex subunit 5 N-terminal [Trinorchestia longiramus]|nr:Integrator complex subunit 5 N-terminal [Trinorchestia longiramus]
MRKVETENEPNPLLKQLDDFLYVASTALSGANPSPNLTAEELSTALSALQLLQTLPAARPAVLSYLGYLLGKQAFHKKGTARPSTSSANNGTEDVPSGSSSDTHAELVMEVEIVLRSLVESEESVCSEGGGLWCELICGWGVELLSLWAVEYGRMNGIIEEIVGMWMSCSVVRAVVGLVALCVSREPQGTVAHVLNTASAHTPVLDWLVAHVGASHPAPVLSYLLDPSVQVSLDPEPLDRTTAILTHLALQHSSAVGQALTALLEKTVQGQCWPGAGPQLLLLLTRSGPLLDTLTSALPSLLAPSTLNKLASQIATWVPTFFRSWADLQQICVQLLLDCAGPSLLLTLLHGLVPIHNAPHDTPLNIHLLPIVKTSLATLLHSLLNELCSLAYTRRGSNKARVSLLVSLAQPTSGATLPLANVLQWALQCGAPVVVRAVTQLVVMSCSQQQQPSEGVLWPYLLHNFPPSPELLHIVARLTLALIREPQAGCNPLERPLAIVLAKSGPSLLNALANVHMLSSAHTLKSPLSDAVMSLLPQLAQFINVPEVGDSVIKLLSKVTLSQPISLRNTSCLANAITCYLMATLGLRDVSKKVTCAGYCGRLLSQLSSSSCGHGLITRLIVEAVFRPEWAYIFGASAPSSSSLEIKKFNASESKQLLQANYTFDSWVKLPLSHTTIFHAGTINGNSKNAKANTISLPPETVTLNCQLLLNILCSASKHHDHAPLTVALLLVEIISPDIMYNGFPWPDENIKFTIERDLTIKKTFEDFPIAWELLEFVASNRPALCYCSVLVRALTASYIALWSTSALSKSLESPKQLRATERLLEIAVIGQFLPKNMHVLPQMVRHLAPHEVVAVLQDVWNYMRDNTPSPDRWTLLPNRQHDRSNHHADPRAFEVCRRLIHFHVETLGHLLPSMLQQRTAAS